MIDQARRRHAERRARSDAAASAYDSFLLEVATPVFRMFASILKAEGYPFTVFTPAGGLRLASERSADDYVELSLDSTVDPPAVMGKINRGRGSRLVTDERPVKPGVAIADLTEQDTLEFLLEAFEPFLER